MPEVSTQDRLKDAQTRYKALQAKRDQVIHEAGAVENKLAEAYAKLRELGVENPENLTAKQLQEMAQAHSSELEQKLTVLETELTNGESLIQGLNS
jgi:vacuolar-type H+-ATPase subunit D/Vma8